MKELRLGFLAGWQVCITLTSQRPPLECLCLIASNRTSNLHHACNLSFFLTHFSSPSFLYSSILMKSPSISLFLMYFNSLAVNMWLFLLTWYHVYTICNLSIYTYELLVQFSSVTQSCPTLWDNMNARPPCLSPTPGVYSNPFPLSRWCHPTISFSVIPFYSGPQSLPASGSFPVSQLFAWDGQSIGVLASASVLPMNTQDWYPLGWTGWIALQSKGLSRVFSNTTVQKASILWHSAFFTV